MEINFLSKNSKKKIMSVVGARPQFIKVAPLSRALDKAGFDEIILHTGQHYDENMSQIFFDEMEIPRPKINLKIGSDTHGAQTAEMLKGIEFYLLQEKPDLVLVLGDTNSTLAGSLAASKLSIPIAHVEAGLRSYNRTMPEEINRLITDHLSHLLFCSNSTGVKNLKLEGIEKGVFITGDIMIDALFHFLPDGNPQEILKKYNIKAKQFILLTIHRPQNADSKKNLENILHAMSEADMPVLFPIHPRTNQTMKAISKSIYENIYFVEPIRYSEILLLQKNSYMVVTDSGGMQKEAFYLKVPCLTIRPETEWPETLENGWNVLVKPQREEILDQLRRSLPNDHNSTPYGSGDAAKKIIKVLMSYFF